MSSIKRSLSMKLSLGIVLMAAGHPVPPVALPHPQRVHGACQQLAQHYDTPCQELLGHY